MDQFHQAAIVLRCHAGWDGVFATRNNRSLIRLTTVPSLPPDTLSGWLPCTCIWQFQILRKERNATCGGYAFIFRNSFSSFRSLISFCNLRISSSSSRRCPLPTKGCSHRNTWYTSNHGEVSGLSELSDDRIFIYVEGFFIHI